MRTIRLLRSLTFPQISAIIRLKKAQDTIGWETGMKRRKYVYWQEDDMWIGYFEEYPDYWTQGKSLEELKENLKDLYKELSSGVIPCVRRVAELEVA